MNVLIDAPEKRSLSHNEQRVYKLLCLGLTDVEVAMKLHMPLLNDPYLIYSDVPPDSVRGLMASIREKGWEIPENNEEENFMARGNKTSDEKIAEVQVLRNDGKSTAAISKETGVPLSTVQRICRRMITEEKEPAPAATDTSSTNPTSKDSTDSISENAENVKNKIPQAVMDALNEEIFTLQEYIDEDKMNIQYLQKKIDDIENFIEQFGGAENEML